MLRQWANQSCYCVVVLAFLIMCEGAGHQRKAGMNQEPMPSHYVNARMAVENFNEAFNRHDVDTLALTLTDDTVFEDTSPPPDGRRIEGKAAVLEFWKQWFARNPDARFETEDVIVSGDRVVILWVYHKTRNGQPWRLRGVDIFTVRDGKIAAKLAYVKG